MKALLKWVKYLFTKENRICRNVADLFNISKREAKGLIEGFLFIDGIQFYLKVNREGSVEGVMIDYKWTGGRDKYAVPLSEGPVLIKEKIDFYKKEINKALDSCEKIQIVTCYDKFHRKYCCLDCFL